VFFASSSRPLSDASDRVTSGPHNAEESALLVPLPELEGALGPYRRLDPAAGFGVPPHVTLLLPFVPIDRLRPDDRTALGELFGSVRAFDCRFEQLSWFGDDVLWLVPEPKAVFVELTTRIWQRFPDNPPYGGAFAEIVPHLTIGDGSAAAGGRVTAAELREAEAGVSRLLPLRATADRALLMAGRREPNGWRVIEEFALGS